MTTKRITIYDRLIRYIYITPCMNYHERGALVALSPGGSSLTTPILQMHIEMNVYVCVY